MKQFWRVKHYNNTQPWIVNEERSGLSKTRHMENISKNGSGTFEEFVTTERILRLIKQAGHLVRQHSFYSGICHVCLVYILVRFRNCSLIRFLHKCVKYCEIYTLLESYYLHITLHTNYTWWPLKKRNISLPNKLIHFINSVIISK